MVTWRIRGILGEKCVLQQYSSPCEEDPLKRLPGGMLVGRRPAVVLFMHPVVVVVAGLALEPGFDFTPRRRRDPS